VIERAKMTTISRFNYWLLGESCGN